jgi:hypothetical protein
MAALGLKLTLAISKHEILVCLIGTKVSDAYDATTQWVQANENSAQGTEKNGDSAEEKDQKQNIFSHLRKQSCQFLYASINKQMESNALH